MVSFTEQFISSSGRASEQGVGLVLSVSLRVSGESLEELDFLLVLSSHILTEGAELGLFSARALVLSHYIAQNRIK